MPLYLDIIPKESILFSNFPHNIKPKIIHKQRQVSTCLDNAFVIPYLLFAALNIIHSILTLKTHFKYGITPIRKMISKLTHDK